MTIDDFLDLVLGSDEGCLCLGFKGTTPFTTEWYEWPKQRDEVVLVATAPIEQDVYFIPHLFERADVTSSALSTKLVSADLDAANLEVLNITPSIIVGTSSTRRQGYWLLHEQVAPETAEALSRALVYSVPEADRTSWPLSYFMRMPFTTSYKRLEPYNISVVGDTLRRFNPQDMEFLPDASPYDDEQLAFINEPPSKEGMSRGPHSIIADAIQTNQIGKRAAAIYTNRVSPGQDRFLAIWQLLLEVLGHGMPRVDAYYLAMMSPNNPYVELKYHAERELAKDVLRAEVLVKTRTRNVREMVNEARHNLRGAGFEKKQQLYNIVLDHMKSDGEFIRVSDSMGYYVQSSRGRPIGILKHHGPMAALLDMQFGINGVEIEQEHIINSLDTMLHHMSVNGIEDALSHYDENTNSVLVHTGRKDVYNITARSIERVTNGARGVVFPWPASCDPFVPIMGELPGGQTWYELLFGSVLDNVIILNKEQATALLVAWFMFLFLRNKAETKPILLFQGQPGAGKCLGKGTPVLLFDGTIKAVEDIVTGDILMGDDSTPRNVLSTTTGMDELYRIVPTKGDPWICNSAHILTLTCSGQGGLVDVPLQKVDTLPSRPRWKLVRTGVDYPRKEILIDPYLVGLWLGDGSTNAPRIATMDWEIIDYCEKVAEWYGAFVSVTKERTAYCISFSSLDQRGPIGLGRGNGTVANPRHLLRRFFETCVVDGVKNIPLDYLTSDEHDRLELLAGLLDTDGYLAKGYFEITLKPYTLIQQVAQLARSLGFASYLSEKKVALTGGHVQTYYRLTISGDVSRIPCKLPRKQAKPRQQIKRTDVTGFTIESIGRGEYFGFELDGNGRFLLGDYTITHNTAMFKRIYAVLYGDARKIGAITSATNFDHASATEALTVFDNVDTSNTWLPDRLAQSSSNTTIEVRKLYSNLETILMNRKSMVGLTSHNPHFSRADVADRLIILTFERVDIFGEFLPEQVLLAPIRRYRNVIWHGVFQSLQAILDSPLPSPTEAPRFRVQDFSYMGLWICRALGLEGAFRSAIDVLTVTQRRFALEDEGLFLDACNTLLQRKETRGMSDTGWMKPTDFFNDLAGVSDPEQFTRKYRNPSQFGRHLVALQNPIKDIYKLSWRPVAGGREWLLQRSTSNGHSVEE